MDKIRVFKAKKPENLNIDRKELYFYQELNDSKYSNLKEPFSSVELTETNSRSGQNFIIKHCPDLFKITVYRTDELNEFYNYLMMSEDEKNIIKDYFMGLESIKNQRKALLDQAEERESILKKQQEAEKDAILSKIYSLIHKKTN